MKKPPPFPPMVLPPDDATFSVREVAGLATCTVRTVRSYIRKKVLHAPEFRSAKTRYSRDFLIRLRAARALAQEGVLLETVARRLQAMKDEQLIRTAHLLAPGDSPPPPNTPPADDKASPPAAAPLTSTAASVPVGRELPRGFEGAYRSGTAPRERWDIFEICPGVKLLVTTDSDAEALRVAREIVTLFGPRS